MILLQTIPGNIDMNKLEKSLVSKFPQIVSYHDLHIWQLSPYKYIATVHIVFHNSSYYANLINEIRAHFLEYNITHVTIQPEFFTEQQQSGGQQKRRSLTPYLMSGSCNSNGRALGKSVNNLSHYSECLIQCSRPECLDKLCCRDSMNDLNEIYTLGGSEDDQNCTVNSSPSTVTGNTTITMISSNQLSSLDSSEHIESTTSITACDGQPSPSEEEIHLEPIPPTALTTISGIDEVQCLKDNNYISKN